MPPPGEASKRQMMFYQVHPFFIATYFPNRRKINIYFVNDLSVVHFLKRYHNVYPSLHFH